MYFQSLFICIIVIHSNVHVIADICVKENHRTLDIQETKKVYSLKSLRVEKGSGYFRTITIDELFQRLIIGSRDHIYVVDEISLKVINIITWNSTTDYNECIASLSSLVTSEYCGNYIQFLKIYENKLLMCGTNYAKPKYRLVTLDTYKTLEEKVNTDICSSPDPNYKTVGELTKYGELISATYKSRAGRKPEFIGGAYLYENPLRIRLTSSTSKYTIIQPEYIKSFHINDSVYVFLMEDAIESNYLKKATVVRLCETDNGGTPIISIEMWTTLRKSRLDCTHTVGNRDIRFHYLADVTYDNSSQLFYAVYHLAKEETIASAVCVFSLVDIEESLNNDFLKYDDKTKTWIATNNGNFLFGCKVNPANLTSEPLRMRSLGKEPTNNLNLEALSTAHLDHLMAKTVTSQTNTFTYMNAGSSFSKVGVESLATTTTSTFLYVATSTGNIIVLKSTINGSCVLEEIETGVLKPKAFLLNQNKRVLYLSSDDAFISIKMENCEKHICKSSCMDSGNPKCGWVEAKQLCVSLKNKEENDIWEQATNMCPKYEDKFTKWSPWKPLEQRDNTARYCLSRERRCRLCGSLACEKYGNTVEIEKCTANNITSVTSWINNGPVNGQWSEWSKYSKCHEGECGNGTTSRSRSCNNPTPANGGNKCVGSIYECKGCFLEADRCFIFWSDWTDWSDCITGNKTKSYFQERKRTCSQTARCNGERYELRACAPFDIRWSAWSLCSCIQKVQHRLPVFIHGCRKCEQLQRAEYRICEPANCTTGDNSTLKVKVEYNHNVDKENFGRYRNGFFVSMQDLIIICCAVFTVCVWICILIVVIILRQFKKKIKYISTQSPNGTIMESKH